MKKFFAILLAAVCVFSVFSCGNDSAADSFAKAMKNTKPSVVNLAVSVETDLGELESSYVTTYNEDGSFSVAYSYESFASVSEGGIDDVVVVKSGTVNCDKDGNYSDGGEIAGKIESLAATKIKINEKKMTVKYSDDGNVLTATVLAKNTKAVFGVEIAADVSFVMTKADGKIVSYTMVYALASGESTEAVNDVVVTCVYK